MLLDILLFVALITACAQAASPTSTTIQQPQVLPAASLSLPLLQVIPEVNSAQLQPMPDLAVAAAQVAVQVAAALEIPAEQVQVQMRIRSKDCTVCRLAEHSGTGLMRLHDPELKCHWLCIGRGCVFT